MSKFLDELKDSVLSCDMEEKLPHRWVDNHEMVGSTIDMIDSLGENARRMLEIGVEMDNQDKELLIYFKSLLKYNSETGIFTWIDDKKSGKNHKRIHVKSGDIAGSLDHRGYRLIRIDNKNYRAHRLAWFFEYGENLDRTNFIIDHINHNADDNRIINLRKVDFSNNQKNALKRIDNKSGVTGVHWCNTWNRWKAQICINGKHKNLGSFLNLEQAIQVRKEAEIKYKFHENHGKTKELIECNS